MRFSTLIALGLMLIMTLGLPAQTVRVVFTSGQASLQRPDEASPRPVLKGETVIVGTRIVTGTDGRVVLTPMPGVTSIIAPNTTLLLESLSETRTSPTEVTHRAVIDLKEGAVVSDLNKPAGVTYDYSIRTARGLAGARGTTFSVGINPFGMQTILVAHGSIAISFLDGSQATLAMGQLSITSVTGETQSVGNVSELSPANQQIAQNWTETTITTLAAAIESGISVDPEALNNALAAAKRLGITLPPALQATVDRALNKLTAPYTARDDVDNTETITEVVTDKVNEDKTREQTPPQEPSTEPAPSPTPDPTPTPQPDPTPTPEPEPQPELTELQSYRASLATDSLRIALDNFVADGDFTDPQLSPLVSDRDFAGKLTSTLQVYETLNTDKRSLLKNLGIMGATNITLVGADTDGLTSLINAYAALTNTNDGPLSVIKLDEADFPQPAPSNNLVSAAVAINPATSSHYFFPGTNGHGGSTIYNITFDSGSGSLLTVGATRTLQIDNTTHGNIAFATAANGKLELRASDLISLNSTLFSSNISSITMAAHTINLSNITFNEGSVASLNSKLGLINFGSTSSNNGKINFVHVHYGSDQSTDLDASNFPVLTRGNIAIGTLAAPAPLPTYTPPVLSVNVSSGL